MGWSLMVFHLCTFLLEAKDCLQNTLECHKGHVLSSHGSGQLVCMVVTRLLPSQSYFLTNLALVAQSSLMIWIKLWLPYFFPVMTAEGQEMAGKHFVAATVPFPAFSLNFFGSRQPITQLLFLEKMRQANSRREVIWNKFRHNLKYWWSSEWEVNCGSYMALVGLSPISKPLSKFQVKEGV